MSGNHHSRAALPWVCICCALVMPSMNAPPRAGFTPFKTGEIVYANGLVRRWENYPWAGIMGSWA